MRREKKIAIIGMAIGTIIAAIIYVSIPAMVNAQASGGVIYGKGAGGAPAPIAAEQSSSDGGYSLKVSVTNTPSVSVTSMPGISLAGTSAVHELGPKVVTNTTTCVLCSTSGDGGTLAVTAGSNVVLSVVDQSGSPVRFANGTPCVDFGPTGVGMMLAPGAYQWEVSTAPDGGTSTFYSCCAQTATASPSGPWICVATDSR
jgi:hypothetical protein